MRTYLLFAMLVIHIGCKDENNDHHSEPNPGTDSEQDQEISESEDLFVGTVAAIDPDSLEAGASNDVRIRYEFEKRLVDYVYFELNPAGSGNIYFKNKKVLVKPGQNVVAGESLIASE